MVAWYCITVDCITWFCGRSGVSLDLFLLLCHRSSFVCNEVGVGDKDVELISARLGVSPYTVKRGIQALVKHGCLKKIRVGSYVVNPRLCFRGSPARAEALWYQHGFRPMK